VDQQTFYTVVAVAAVVITLSFIIQAVVFLFVYGQIKKLVAVANSVQTKVEPLIARADPLIDKVGPVVDQVQETITTVRSTVDKISAQARETIEKVTVETRAVAAAISASSLEITGVARQQAQQISQTIDLATSTLQRQVADLDALVTRTEERIESTTVEVQTTVIEPIREVSALLIGLKRAINTLFLRDRKQIDQAYQDEEMFI
jgi:hypothetical protein